MESELEFFMKWKSIVRDVARVIKTIYPDAEVYVVGGAAEDRLTILSDVDILVVLNRGAREKVEILANIWRGLEEEDIPLYYPIDIHIATSQEELKRYRKKIKVDI